MKSVRKDGIESNIPFPKLMLHTVTGCIIMMQDSYRGMVVHGNGKPNMIGHIGSYSAELVTDFKGKVTLSNED